MSRSMTVNFVMGKRDFSVLDRANLKKILAEHKLTALGGGPGQREEARPVCRVDALIMGNMVQLG